MEEFSSRDGLKRMRLEGCWERRRRVVKRSRKYRFGRRRTRWLSRGTRSLSVLCKLRRVQRSEGFADALFWVLVGRKLRCLQELFVSLFFSSFAPHSADPFLTGLAIQLRPSHHQLRPYVLPFMHPEHLDEEGESKSSRGDASFVSSPPLSRFALSHPFFFFNSI